MQVQTSTVHRTTPESVKDLNLDARKREKLDGYVHRYMQEAQKPLARNPESRLQQFANLDKTLTEFAADRELGHLFKNDQKLLQDTVKDKVLMNSPFISSPTHAMELKRLGLQPSEAGQVGRFTDVALQKEMKRLGGGEMNTVYKGKYTLADGKTSFKGVFKAEGDWQKERPGAAMDTGIDLKHPRGGYRNVATTRLDEALGFGGLTTRSEMAVHSNTLGTVSEMARGKSPQGSAGEGKVIPDIMAAYNSGEVKDGAQVGKRILKDGKEEYFHKGSTVRNINYNDPLLRRDLVRLQLMDSIAGQADRHHGNYFVEQDQGKYKGLKGIDNDLSWGEKLKSFQKIPDTLRLPAHLPPVVDRDAYNSVLKLTPDTFRQKMGGLLTTEEMNAASERLKLVQEHLKDASKCMVIDKESDWNSPEITKRLRQTIDGGHTNYLSRDIEDQETKMAKGLVIDYDK